MAMGVTVRRAVIMRVGEHRAVRQRMGVRFDFPVAHLVGTGLGAATFLTHKSMVT